MSDDDFDVIRALNTPGRARLWFRTRQRITRANEFDSNEAADDSRTAFLGQRMQQPELLEISCRTGGDEDETQSFGSVVREMRNRMVPVNRTVTREKTNRLRGTKMSERTRIVPARGKATIRLKSRAAQDQEQLENDDRNDSRRSHYTIDYLDRVGGEPSLPAALLFRRRLLLLL